MVSDRPTRKVIRELRNAGFAPLRTEASHTVWAHPSGARVTIADGHRTTSPGVYRKVLRAIAEAQEER